MHFVYDFDSTLYATKRLWDVWADLLVPYGFSREHLLAVADEITPRGFSCPTHARTLGLGEEQIASAMAQFVQQLNDVSPGFIYDDVLPLLNAQRQAQIRHSVVTHGDAEHQWLKINTSGLDQHLTDVRIANQDVPKIQHLRDLLATTDTPLVFVDDNPKELKRVIDAALPVRLVRIVRAGDFSDFAHPSDDEHWEVIRSLDVLSSPRLQ